jgi:ubiquinone/menaquinone biosynthesis C-methylase UbiE
MKTIISEPHKRKAYKGIAMEGIIARQYNRIQKNMIEQYKSWARLVSDNVVPGSNVLELAPGPGYLSVELAKLGNYNLTGLDISGTFVKIAKNKAKEAGVKVEFRQGDAAYTPYPSDSFDFVICTSAFKNFPEPIKVIDEVFRVLKTGAKAVIIDLSKDVPKARINDYIDRMNLNWIDLYFTKLTFKSLVKSAYTKTEIQKIIAQSRFKQCEIINEDVGFEIWLKKLEPQP